MVRGRAGGTGPPSNLGEVTATRCALRLDGVEGHAFVQGRDAAPAAHAAWIDALMRTGRTDALRRDVLAPLAEAERLRRGTRAQKAEATRADFETMARGRTDGARRRAVGARTLAAVGPSGVGKDTLIRALVATDPRMVWLRRVVTRPADPTEPFVPATDEAFDATIAGFAPRWRAHGLRYGVPRAQIAALGPGETGVVNLSRGVLARAAGTLPRLAVLSVTAPASVLVERLAARGRETRADIAARLARPAPPVPQGLPALILDNGGPLERSVEEARRWLAQVAA